MELLMENIQEYSSDTTDSAMRRAEHIVKAHICSLIEKQPAYDVDKVVKQLEELPKDSTWNHNSDNINRKRAIEIVKGGGMN